MSDDRELIFARIRQALSALPQRTALPAFETELLLSRHAKSPLPRIELFRQRLERVNGRVFRDVAGLAEFLRERKALRGYVDPTLLGLVAPALRSPFQLYTDYQRARVDDYDFGLTRAAGGIAETGSLVLNDAVTSRRLGALTPWIHVALLYESELYLHLPEAVAALGDDPNVVFCTGPSKTADVEGILIEGVHGPGEQVALLLPDR
ncbi:MAG: LUD domain-containing protein [Polyangiaceae bacterium]